VRPAEPRLHRFFNVGLDLGLTSVLTGTVKLSEALNERCRPFRRGKRFSPANPAELLGTNEMQRVLHELRARFDFIVGRCPALLVADAISIAPFVTGDRGG
jgi:Mrp family chromosome partitioning ATPase